MVELVSVANNTGSGPIDVQSKEEEKPNPNINEVRNVLRDRLGDTPHTFRFFENADPDDKAEGANINRAGDIDRSHGRNGEIALVVDVWDSKGQKSSQTIIFESASDAADFVDDIQSNIGEKAVLLNEPAMLTVGRSAEGIKQQAEIESLSENIASDLSELDPILLPRELRIFSSSHDASSYADYQNQKGDNKRGEGLPGEVALLVRVEDGTVSRWAVFTFSSAPKAAAFVSGAPLHQDVFEDIAFVGSRETLELDSLARHELREPLGVLERNGIEDLQSQIGAPVGIPLSQEAIQNTLVDLSYQNTNANNELGMSDNREKLHLVEITAGDSVVFGIVPRGQLETIRGEAEHLFQKGDYGFRVLGP